MRLQPILKLLQTNAAYSAASRAYGTDRRWGSHSDIISEEVPNSDLYHDILISQAIVMPCPVELKKTADILNKGGKNIIQVDIKAAHIGRRCAVTIGIIGHVRPTLVEMTKLLKQNNDTKFLPKVQARRAKWDKSMDKKASLKKRKMIPPQALTCFASDLADDDAVFIADVGEVTAFAARHLRMRGNQRLLSSFNHGFIGVGLPGAMGIQALDKKRQTVALCGDGVFGMMMQDFVTVVRYELPLTCIVYNNEKLGFVELEMQAAGFPKYGTKLVNPDFAAYAEICGGKGITVTKPEEFEQAVRTACSAKEPYILDVKINPDELIMPPKIDPAHVW